MDASKRPLRAALLLLSLAAGGCSVINEYEDPTIVGRWKSDPHEIQVGLAGDGKATMHFGQDPNVVIDSYRVEWEHDDIDIFVLELKCRSSTGPTPCPSHDLKCEVEDDTMRCKSPSIPNLRDLKWKRR